MVGGFFYEFLSALDVCDYFEETALDLEELKRMFVASADGDFVIILYMIFVNLLDLGQTLLLDLCTKDE